MNWLRRLLQWPRGLAAQLILATAAVLLIAQGAVVAVAVHERVERFDRVAARFVAQRLQVVVRLLETTPPELHDGILRVASAPGFRFSIRRRLPGLPPAPLLNAWLAPHLQAQGLNGTVILRGRPRGGRGDDDDRDERDDRHDRHDRNERNNHRMAGDGAEGGKDRPHNALRAPVTDSRGDYSRSAGVIAVPLSNRDAWLLLEARRDRAPPWPRYAFWSLALAVAGSVVMIALLVRRAMGPLRSLTAAAERLGRGEAVPPVDETGPSDVRTAIAAFNRMQERLHRFVADRTRMIAAISHDLRSPLTALRLRAEMVDQEDLRERMIASLDEMQAMIEATLAFAKEDAAAENTVRTDLAAMVDEVVQQRRDAGHTIAWTRPPARLYPCRPIALKRAVGNLLDNALQYGAEVSIALEDSRIAVRDRGPGIPEEQIDFVFEPFARLEASRNIETGGTGLGLAIARSIANSHGGDVRLSNRDGGGLEALLELPPEGHGS